MDNTEKFKKATESVKKSGEAKVAKAEERKIIPVMQSLISEGLNVKQ